MGRSGGIWLLWNDSQIDIKVIHKEQRFIAPISTEKSTNTMFVSIFVYTPPN